MRPARRKAPRSVVGVKWLRCSSGRSCGHAAPKPVPVDAAQVGHLDHDVAAGRGVLGQRPEEVVAAVHVLEHMERGHDVVAVPVETGLVEQARMHVESAALGDLRRIFHGLDARGGPSVPHRALHDLAAPAADVEESARRRRRAGEAAHAQVGGVPEERLEVGVEDVEPEPELGLALEVAVDVDVVGRDELGGVHEVAGRALVAGAVDPPML